MAVIPLFTDEPREHRPARGRKAPAGSGRSVPASQPDLTGLSVGRGRPAASNRSGGPGRRMPPPPASALALIEQARGGLATAAAAAEPAERYAAAHLAALRGAAAVVAVRARPDRRRTRPLSVWALLASVAPELREWAAFFAAGSRTRAAVEAGVTRLVTSRDADDLVRQAEEFVDLAERLVRGDGR